MKIENKYQKEVPNSENVIAQKSYGSDTLSSRIDSKNDWINQFIIHIHLILTSFQEPVY